MMLKSFGCSFIFGSDLQDTNLSWPALVAQHYNLPYSCLARPGSGNLQIAETILNHVSAEPTLFVIGWTWIDRFDFVDMSNDQWHTLLPVDSNDVAKNYYKNLHSEYRDKLVNLMEIKLVLDTLLREKQPFVMTYMDDLLFDQRWHVSPAIIQLQNFIQPYMTTFDTQTFLNWSKTNSFTISDSWHPLEQAHSAAAELMIKVFDKQKIVDPVQQAHV